MESCSYSAATGALHVGTETDAARNWRNEGTCEILILKFSPNYMLYILGIVGWVAQSV